MLKCNSLFFITLFFCCFAMAQKSKTYKIMPGENILEVIPADELYQYPQFQNGVIYFKNGVRSSAKLNYSFLTQEFLFVNSKGDTLSIASPGDVKNAVIGSDYFYYTGSRFVKKDTVIGEIKLATTAFFQLLTGAGRVHLEQQLMQGLILTALLREAHLEGKMYSKLL